MRDVHVLVPDSIDDPARPSGGNVYDRQVCDGLVEAGWRVTEHHLAGTWPWPDAAALRRLELVVADIPDRSTVVVDGLVGSTVPSVLVPAAERLHLVMLVHLPLGDGPPGHRVRDAHHLERAVLTAAAAVITTSAWTRERLVSGYALPAGQIHVAEPGVRPAAPAAGTPDGGQLLCVAAVTRHKGHDLLLAALATLRDLPWRVDFVGRLDREADFVASLVQQAARLGVGDRVSLSGPRVGADLAQSYAAADVLVLASHAETYGMVVTEALAHGLPVIATGVGGVPDALGRAPDGCPPGLLVPPADPSALSAALRYWLSDVAVRGRLRRAAEQRRQALPAWSVTADCVARVLSGVAT